MSDLVCLEMIKLQREYGEISWSVGVEERQAKLAEISTHRTKCKTCSGEYQLAGLQQLHDEAFAGSWGLKHG